MRTKYKVATSYLGARLVSILGILIFGLAGCASITPSRMVPDVKVESDQNAAYSVRIREVVGGRDGDFGGFARVNNEQFSVALLQTLKKSNLFRAVDTAGGDLDLYVSIQSQGVSPVFPGFAATLVVTYKFVDGAGRTVWLESYESSFEHVAFSGATRTVMSREGAVRENLAAFIQGVKERRPVAR